MIARPDALLSRVAKFPSEKERIKYSGFVCDVVSVDTTDDGLQHVVLAYHTTSPVYARDDDAGESGALATQVGFVLK